MVEIDRLKAQLSNEFDMKDLGAAKKIVGMEILRNKGEGRVFLYQKKYIEKVLKRVGMLDAKLVKTSLAAHFRLYVELSPQTWRKSSTCLTFLVRVQLGVSYML